MGGDSSGNLKRNGVNLGKCAIGARKNEMKTDSLNLPGYPEASQDATFVTGQATQVFRALGEKLRQRKWGAEHPGTKFAGRNSRKRIRERRGFGTGIIRSRRERAGGLALSLRHAERTFQDEAVSRNGGAIQREGCRLRQGERYAARASLGGDDVRPGTMTILSDRWEGAERENVMRHELAHQFIVTLGQMMGNENERRRMQGLPHLSDDSLVPLKAKLAK